MNAQHQNCEESAFLFGAKKIRCYGSIADLNSPTTSAPKFVSLAVHKVQPNDTLQNLELRYNSSMFEIKRINRLWSNQSLYCKTEILIPIFEENASKSKEEALLYDNTTINFKKQKDKLKERSNGENMEDESLDQFLRRIDLSMRKTKSAIGRFDRMVLENDKSYDF
uniref:LysM domain-containing protein n=2 Tax=Meloidogyne TaxID=189290 RepID=A0A914LS28_MELIC|nr:unnamed protein product [Meloidogyne enterolobii]